MVSVVSPRPIITCHGAARAVTGSMHLIEAAGRRILLDCGVVRASRDRSRTHEFAFEPSSLDAVILSHAHTDHSGNLPNLVRHGFRGPIYSTPETRDLTEIMLADSARIREESEVTASIITGRVPPEHGTIVDEIRQTMGQFVRVPYDQLTTLAPDIGFSFTDSGHILGSAVTTLRFRHGLRDYRVAFTGDLGRRGLPFLPDPAPLPAADLVLSECTYGGRRHDHVEAMARKMSEVAFGAVDRGGKILVPAFSLGRTQIVVHYFRKWMRAGLLPELPIYVDSPLAAKIAAVYDRHASRFAEYHEPHDPPAQYLTPDAALDVSAAPAPCVLVASGGMCDSGRIVHHLRHHIDDPRAVLVLVSYQAPHSLGAKLLERHPTVRFHGRQWNKWIEVATMNGFSGHADHDDLLHLLQPLAGSRVALVHGEPDSAEALARDLRPMGFADVQIPHRGEPIEL